MLESDEIEISAELDRRDSLKPKLPVVYSARLFAGKWTVGKDNSSPFPLRYSKKHRADELANLLNELEKEETRGE